MRNDSNMVFQDYYDYEGLNAAVSYTQIITEKLYAAVSVNYMRTSYKSRKVSAGDETQIDDFCSPRVLVFYDITKDLTWLLTYSYNQADSNDPGQEYSGHMVTSGLYYSF